MSREPRLSCLFRHRKVIQLNWHSYVQHTRHNPGAEPHKRAKEVSIPPTGSFLDIRSITIVRIHE